MTKVSELLKERMNELKISADEIANYCGVNRATVYRWLNGEIDNMKRSNIASLAQILRLDPALERRPYNRMVMRFFFVFSKKRKEKRKDFSKT